MNIRDIDLNLLVLFDALMRHRSVSRAALEVGITQPALSNALARLRKQLGDPLLVRTSHGMEPTEKAQELHQPIMRAIEQLKVAISPASAFEPSTSTRQFSIGASDYVDIHLMPAVVRRLHREAPRVSLNMGRTNEIAYSDVERGDVDFLIDVFETKLPDSFYSQHLLKDDYCCICREGHPGLDAEGHLSLEAFLKYSHVYVTKTGVGLSEIDRVLQQLGEARHVTMITRMSFLVSPFVVLETDLLATVPRKNAELMKRFLPISVTDSPLELQSFQLDLAWGPLAQHSPAHRWLRQILIEEARGAG